MKDVGKKLSSNSMPPELEESIISRAKVSSRVIGRPGDSLRFTAKREKNGWGKWQDGSGNSFDSLEQAINQLPPSIEVRAEVAYESPKVWNVSCDGNTYTSDSASLEYLLQNELKGKTVQLTGESHRSGLLPWAMQIYHGDDSPAEALYGGGRKRLEKELGKRGFYLNCECDNLKVLVCTRIEYEKRTENFKIPSSWIVIDPGNPFTEQGNEISFPRINIDLELEEAYACDETRLAFLYQSKLWVIRNVAKKSISNFFKLNTLFREVLMEDSLLSVGLSLAALMYDVLETVRLFYRKTGRIYSIVAISGSSFEKYDTLKEIATALDYLQHRGGAVTKWRVTDDEINIEVRMPSATADYQTLIKLEMPDLPGSSVSATAYAKIGRSEMCIRKSALSHTKRFTELGGFVYLFENRNNECNNNVLEAIDEFQNAFQLLYSTTAVYTESTLAPFAGFLGQKRMKKATKRLSEHMQLEHAYAAIDLFRDVLKATYRTNLDSIRFDIVSMLYGELFNSLIGEKVIAPNPKNKTRSVAAVTQNESCVSEKKVAKS